MEVAKTGSMSRFHLFNPLRGKVVITLEHNNKIKQSTAPAAIPLSFIAAGELGC
jgi:hypothetical protein